MIRWMTLSILLLACEASANGHSLLYVQTEARSGSVAPASPVPFGFNEVDKETERFELRTQPGHTAGSVEWKARFVSTARGPDVTVEDLELRVLDTTKTSLFRDPVGATPLDSGDVVTGILPLGDPGRFVIEVSYTVRYQLWTGPGRMSRALRSVFPTSTQRRTLRLPVPEPVFTSVGPRHR